MDSLRSRQPRSAMRLTVALILTLVALAGPSTSDAASGSWSSVGLGGTAINAITVDPTNASILFAGSAGAGVFRSTDKAATFAAANSGLADLFVNDLVVSPINPSVVLAGTGQGAAIGEPTNGVYRSTNRGANWTRVTGGFIAAFAIDPENPQTVYAGGAPAIQKSTDGGATWKMSFPANSDIANTDIRGVAVNPQNASVLLAVGTTEGGTGRVFRSTDAGATWSLVLSGLAPTFDVIFQSATVAFFGNQIGIFRSTDAGLTWVRVATSLGNVPIADLLVDPLNPSRVFAGSSSQGVFQTTDGVNWTALDSTLANRSVRGLGIDRVTPETLYAGTNSGIFAFTFAAPPPPPAARSTWFFAEGSSQPPFETWFLIENPGSVATTVTFTFQLQGDGITTRQFVVGPTSRFSLFTNLVIPNQAFSTRIDADQPVFAERAMFVSFDGSDVTGIRSPSRLWLFGEGSTQPPFQTWLLLQNPNDQPASATITYRRENGTTATQGLVLSPNSRTSVFVNQVLPNTAFSTQVTSDRDIVVERSLFRFPGNAAVADSGANAAATSWFFAEGGRTEHGLSADTFLLVQNPNSFGVQYTITLFDTAGNVQTSRQAVGPNSRQTIFLNGLTSFTSFGIRVESGAPLIAERSVFFGPEPRGAFGKRGATTLGTVWNLPEGSTAPPFDEVISVLNPNNTSVTATFTFFLEGGQTVTRQFTIGPTRKFSLNVDTIIPSSAVSTRVTTNGSVVVERTLFLAKLGHLGATSAIGIQP